MDTGAQRRVDVDVDLLEQLDAIAGERGLSPALLVRRAIVHSLETERLRRADEAYAAAYRAIPQDVALVEAFVERALETWPAWSTDEDGTPPRVPGLDAVVREGAPDHLLGTDGVLSGPDRPPSASW